MTAASLRDTFDAYYVEARRLQREFGPHIEILVGMETEWIRPSDADLISDLRAKHKVDFIVGSVHHVSEIPIDYDRDTYAQAVELSGSGKTGDDASSREEAFYLDYFDAQLDMLEKLKPDVVGHFDLIRYLSQEPDASLKGSASVWEKVLRNLACVRNYGGFLEINTSGLRKGLAEPYPCANICKVSVSATAAGSRLMMCFSGLCGAGRKVRLVGRQPPC